MTQNPFVYLEDAFLESEDIVKLLGILIDKELTFHDARSEGGIR